MSAIISIILLVLFYKWILELIFGKSNNGFFSSFSLRNIFLVLQKIFVALFRLIGWIIKTFFEFVAWILKAALEILKWLFRVLIYNPRR